MDWSRSAGEESSIVVAEVGKIAVEVGGRGWTGTTVVARTAAEGQNTPVAERAAKEEVAVCAEWE